MNDESLTSLTLIERAVGRCDEAWTQMVRTYFPLICYWARNFGLNQQDSENVCQDVFVRLFRFLSRFQPTRRAGAFRSWLKTIVQHAVYDYRRGAEFQTEGNSFFESLAAFSSGSESSEFSIQIERQLLLRQITQIVCEQFSPVHAEAFRLVVVEQMPVAEVANRLGISRNVVYQAKSRILSGIRQRLVDLNEPLDPTG